MIIGITGTVGAGKGEISGYLQKMDFRHFSVRDFLMAELNRRGLPIRRDVMTPLADELRKTRGASYIIEQLYALAKAEGGNAVIESVRASAEVDFLKKQQAIIMAVDAEPKVRYDRIVLRKSALDNVTYEKFLADEQREMGSDDATRGNIADCIRRADYTFRNDGTREELQAQVDKVLIKIL